MLLIKMIAIANSNDASKKSNKRKQRSTQNKKPVTTVHNLSKRAKRRHIQEAAQKQTFPSFDENFT